MRAIANTAVCAVLLWLVAGCGDDGRRRGSGATDAGGPGSADAGWEYRGGGDGCVDGARWIYLLDSEQNLLRFEPPERRITEVGTLDCYGSMPIDFGPFSMSVDRNAMAWVLYQDGNLFHVSTVDASCTPTSFERAQRGFELFGMGFAADGPGNPSETLFIGGGERFSVGTGSSTLGSLDTETLSVGSIGSLPGWPELTGTGDGELWGFMPDTSPPSVRHLDKSTGETLTSFPLDNLQIGQARAWAFAFWGGHFYIFLHGPEDTSSNVYQVPLEFGTAEEIIHDTGRRIVGAGVSTCAPVELI